MTYNVFGGTLNIAQLNSTYLLTYFHGKTGVLTGISTPPGQFLGTFITR